LRTVATVYANGKINIFGKAPDAAQSFI